MWKLWKEYEIATKGLRQIQIGRNLLDLASVVELSDDEAKLGVDETPVVYSEHFTATEWDRIVKWGLIAQRIEEVERIGRSLHPSSPPP